MLSCVGMKCAQRLFMFRCPDRYKIQETLFNVGLHRPYTETLAQLYMFQKRRIVACDVTAPLLEKEINTFTL